ncbi:MAG TPA: azurin [Pusillimonas sp.]|uniref:azurin n=1 Tax=unclassified Pusillimonas TaxID=2640016 RepID=UPI0026016A0C|nr:MULTISPECIES: azurin [unclassified Pusillimonas]HLU19448.1 azurin [Pusillimonas sp.]
MFAKFALAAILSAAALPAMAANCETVIEGNDAMQFNLKEITVDKSCEKYTVTLKHVGKLPVSAMGHNWVLTTTDNMEATAKDGMAAGAANGYLKPNDDRVIAHTDMIGGGEESSVTFDVNKLTAGENYTYFCSFPGHWAIMKGTLKLGS